MHADAGGGRRFAVEVACTGEVVECGFQGKLVISARSVRIHFQDRQPRRHLRLVMLIGIVHESIDLILKHLVEERICMTCPQGIFLERLLAPLL